MNYIEDFLMKAHKDILANKLDVVNSTICGCIVCLETFSPTQISEWVIEPNKKDETAVCPKCKMDCVLGSKYPITDKSFLQAMHNYFISDQQF